VRNTGVNDCAWQVDDLVKVASDRFAESRTVAAYDRSWPVPAADSRLGEEIAGAVSAIPAGNAFLVSTLVSNPASPSVIYQHLPQGGNQLSASIGCSWVMLDAKCRGLKIRVSVVRFRPWPPQISLTLHNLQSGCAVEVLVH
jgi:hypothetical protein